ncbi:MAG: hypothetical protein ACR2J5_11625 [Geodermatophilaceae bacterium]
MQWVVALFPERIEGSLAITELGQLEPQGDPPVGSAQVLVRPEQVSLHSADGGRPAKVTRSDFNGGYALVLLTCPRGPT